METKLEGLTDAELNEIFAVEVCGHEIKQAPKKDCGYWMRSRYPTTEWKGGINYCTDASAVLPWLEKLDGYTARRCFDYDNSRVTEVRVFPVLRYVGSYRPEFIASAPTFARAAVLALIQAKRACQPAQPQP